MPLGISFYTFTQLSFVWEIYKGDKTNITFMKYTLFVNYFPHLIAGPLIHYRNLINQFEDVHSTFKKYKFSFVGLIIFTIGLSKKILIADNIAIYSNFLFNYVHDYKNPNFFLAWFGSISYSIQLYFDFSGYSDMAVGISLMFGILLPVNFNNPFKQNSIIDFWQSWHISLTKYIYEYIYTPITIFLYRSLYNYKHINIMLIIFPTIITMLVAGVWHGANITFVFFGIMHAFYLIINHIYRKIKKNKNINDNNKIITFIYLVLTLLCVLLGHVMFRSTNVIDAFKIYESMIGFSSVLNSIHNFNQFNINLLFEIENQTFDTLQFINIFIISILGIIFLPNTYSIVEKLKLNNNLSIILNLYKTHLFFKKILFLSIPVLLYFCITFMNDSNEFLYFQF